MNEQIANRYKVKQFSSIDLFNTNIQLDKQDLNILYLNAGLVRNKIDKLEAYVAQIKRETHIIMVTETWVDEHEKPYYNLPGYNVVYSSQTKKGGGGCAIFCRNNLTTNVTKDIERNNINYILVFVQELKTSFAAIYNPSNKNDNVRNTMQILEEELCKQTKPTWIIGDLNIDLLKNSNSERQYRDLLLAIKI